MGFVDIVVGVVPLDRPNPNLLDAKNPEAHNRKRRREKNGEERSEKNRSNSSIKNITHPRTSTYRGEQKKKGIVSYKFRPAAHSFFTFIFAIFPSILNPSTKHPNRFEGIQQHHHHGSVDAREFQMNLSHQSQPMSRTLLPHRAKTYVARD